MVVGTGASITTSGTGTITPSAISLTATGAGGVVASGTSGQIYTSAGSGSAPTWQSGVALTGLTADTTPAAGDLYLIYSQAATATESITGTVLFGSPPPIGATTAAAGNFTTLGVTGNLTTNVTGSAQCLQVNTSGVVSGSGAACGGGGSPAFSSITSGTNTTAAMVLGTGSSLKLLGSSTGGVTFASADVGTTNYTATFPNNTGTLAELNLPQSWTAIQLFNNNDIQINSGGGGETALAGANAGAGDVTLTLPDVTDTLAVLGTAQTFTAAQTFNNVELAASQSGAGNGFYNGTAGNQINVSVNGASVGDFTSTGLNSTAIGATATSTAAFTTLSSTQTTSLNNNVNFNTLISTGTNNIGAAIGGGAGPVSINTSATGVYDVANHLLFSAAAPTISSGFGTSPSISHNNGTLSFSVNVGTGGSATSGVIGLPTAVNAWSCWASDTGATPTGQTEPTAGTTTTITLTNYSRTAGTPVAWTASEIIQVGCAGN